MNIPAASISCVAPNCMIAISGLPSEVYNLGLPPPDTMSDSL